MLAPVAIQAGRHAGEQVARLIVGEPAARFRYHDKGMMAVLGRGDAVAELPLLLGAGTSGRLGVGEAAPAAAIGCDSVNCRPGCSGSGSTSPT